MSNKFKFQFSPKAEKEFIQLGKTLQQRIFKKLSFFEIQENPLSYSKPLTNTQKHFRFRIGDYRIIVTPKDKDTFIILLILKIAHRKDVYSA